jgi:hypothetical protein
MTAATVKAQKQYKYMYEVLSTNSPFCGRADYIFSTELLRAGRHYEVRVNNETRNPRILEVLIELVGSLGSRSHKSRRDPHRRMRCSLGKQPVGCALMDGTEPSQRPASRVHAGGIAISL